MSFAQKTTSSKNFKVIVLSTFFLISGLGWLGMWIYGQFYISTDNAYINGNVVEIAPRITGQIINSYVINNQFVQKNQALFEIDPVPYQVALQKAEAEVAINQAELYNAEQAAKRKIALVKKKFLSSQEGDNAVTALSKAESQLKFAEANLQQAQLDFNYTKVFAPESGLIANFNLRVGDIVNVNQPLFVLISNQEFWIDANFKETEMARIKVGQAARIKVDMYPDHIFDGVVESISGSSGNAFSLLPPQNATGNWVKVTQRVPVRIRVIHLDPHYPLRIGTSAEVRVVLR